MDTGFESRLEKIVREWKELIAIESVGADPMKLKECVQCALWIKDWLAPLGFKSELIASENAKGAPPVVFAERPGDESLPTILFYGHYDVQPADPIEAWETPPFELTIKDDGRAYARGANDDKGQWFAFLNGVKSLIEEGRSLPRIKILLEGQEESGSPALTVIAPEIRSKIAADVMLVCDTNAAEGLRPAIVAGLRGVGHFTVRLKGPSIDLHSGEFGGVAPNPAQGIAELVASLHHADGSIAVKGFCDGIIPPTEEESTAAAQSAPDDETLERTMGVKPVGGQAGLSSVARMSFAPTIEVNGIHGGYGGPGSKTVIPTEAFAKISMRLVPGQSPKHVMSAVKEHLRKRCPRGLTLSIEDGSEPAPGLRLPLSSPVFRLATHVLSELDPRGPVFHWDGASIPIVGVLAQVSGAAPLIVGFGQSEDRIHAPNESYGLNQFEKSYLWARAIMTAF